MGDWLVGAEYPIIRPWLVQSLAGTTPKTTGTAYFIAFTHDPVSNLPVYDDGIGIFGPTPFHFPMAYIPALGAWYGFYSVPEALRDREVTIVAYHSTHPIPLPEHHSVIGISNDGLLEQLGGVSVASVLTTSTG